MCAGGPVFDEFIHIWAVRNGIPASAVTELIRGFTKLGVPSPRLDAPHPQGTEAEAQRLIRLSSSETSTVFWRNNVGAFNDATGRLVRYGLGNDSARVNKIMKSSDLIGVTPHVVRLEDVGRTIGVFTTCEVKRPGWSFTGNEQESAQQNFLKAVLIRGGIGAFATSPQEFIEAVHRWREGRT